MKIPDLINELFESREMSEYLVEHSEELSKHNNTKTNKKRKLKNSDGVTAKELRKYVEEKTNEKN